MGELDVRLLLRLLRDEPDPTEDRRMEMYREWCRSRGREPVPRQPGPAPDVHHREPLRLSEPDPKSVALSARPHSEDASYRQSDGKNTEGDCSNNVHGIESLRVESERVDEKHARENCEGKVVSGSPDRHV